MKPYQVVVGNIGYVYDGSNYMQARAKYASYVKDSKNNYGRAAGEPVTLLHNGEIAAEYFGTLEQDIDDNPRRVAREIENRWGDRLSIGMPVVIRHARGGANTFGVIAGFDLRSEYAKAYGPTVKLDSGGSASIDDVHPGHSPNIDVNPRLIAAHARTVKRTATEKILVYPLRQSTGETLYGSRIGGYVVAHGFKTRKAAKAAAVKARKTRTRKNPAFGRAPKGVDYIELRDETGKVWARFDAKYTPQGTMKLAAEAVAKRYGKTVSAHRITRK